MEGYLYFAIAILIILTLNLFKTTRNFLTQYLSEFLTAIGTIGLTVTDIQSGSDSVFIGTNSWKDVWGILLIIFGLILLLAIIIGAKRNLHNRTVQGEINKNLQLKKSIEAYQEEYYKLCSNNILHLFESFYTTGGERISIYKHQGDHFTLLGRCSMNSAYNKSTNYKYRDNEGLIGKGWEENEVFINGSPKWVGKGSEYKNFMKTKCNITDKRLKKIRMKSRSLFIKTINDNNTASNPDGIIVFESMNPTKIGIDECNLLINDNEKALLTLLKNMKNLTKKT
tara:strand:- start:179 stop:1027 length:849 start_codon:yes stop_codon:yes gene_type:complete